MATVASGELSPSPLREGADVAISYFNEHEDAAETARLVEAAGRQVLRMDGDIQDDDHCHRLVQQTVDTLGRIDILVNNAAYQMPHASIEAFSSEQIERTFRTNVFSMFYLCKAAIPQMKVGSSIINTTSIEAFVPEAKLLDYASTKATIIAFTKALSKLTIDQGIRVNAVAPGPAWTPLIPYSFSEDEIQEFGKSSLLGRPAQPAELAPVYVLLASPEASYITGEIYGVTGGKMPY